MPRSSDRDYNPQDGLHDGSRQGLYDHVLISCPQQFCKTGFMISPISLMKRLRPSLRPLASYYRLPATKGSELVTREGMMRLLDRWSSGTGQEGNERGTRAQKAKEAVTLRDPKGQAALPQTWLSSEPEPRALIPTGRAGHCGGDEVGKGLLAGGSPASPACWQTPSPQAGGQMSPTPPPGPRAVGNIVGPAHGGNGSHVSIKVSTGVGAADDPRP